MWIAIDKRKLTAISAPVRCGTIYYLYDATIVNDCNFLDIESVIPSEEYVYVSEGLIVYRKGIRYDLYVIDRSADGGTTWVLDLVQLDPDEDSIIIDIDSGVSGYRQVVRNTAYCIDEELTPTGFAGTEGLDWQNIYNTNIP